MNWDAVGALAELAGAFGVIVTLGYLALQIRRSNVLAVAESRRFRMQISSPSIMSIAENPDLARVFREGLAGRDALTSDDKLRFDMLMGELIGSMSVALSDQSLLGHGAVPEFEGLAENIRTFLAAPGGASWWSDYRGRVANAERATIERILRHSDPPAA